MKRNHIVGVNEMVAIAAALTLAACDHAPMPEPVVRIVETKVPVAVPCKVALTEPKHPDTVAAIKAAPGAEDRYQLIAAGRQIWIAWTNQLEAALKGCGGTVQP